MLAIGLAEPLRQVMIRDLAAGVTRGEPIRFKKYVTRLAFSPDGSKLAAASMDTTVSLVDVATGHAIGEPLRHSEAIRGLAFSPDGRLLLTVSMGSSGTGAARLWDVATGRPASPVFTHPNADTTGALAFSPDGSIFATGCDDGSVYLWDVAAARQIGPPRMLRGRILELIFRPDGRDLMAVNDRGDVRSWPVLRLRKNPSIGWSGACRCGADSSWMPAGKSWSSTPTRGVVDVTRPVTNPNLRSRPTSRTAMSFWLGTPRPWAMAWRRPGIWNG